MELKINQDLDNLSKWNMRNSLEMNPSKSQYLVFGNSYQHEAIVLTIACLQSPKIMISGQEIERVGSAKNLGQLMDGDLRFEQQENSKIKNFL